MIIASSNMQMSSKRSYSQSVTTRTATKMTALGSVNGAYVRQGNDQGNASVYSRSAQVSVSFQNSIAHSLGQSDEQALPSESYLSTGGTTASGIFARRNTDAHQQIRRMLLQYVEMIRELMLSRLSGHHSHSYTVSLSGSGQSDYGILDLTQSGENGMTTWYREDATTYTYTECEATAFSGKGCVVTADGRELSIDLQLNMSRSFTESLTSYSDSVETMLTDPLIIQLEDAPISVSDEKFTFDIDSDGVTEQISKLSGGAAFLALDKNGDGKINDGSELFGTASGNGFRDLSAYDEDNNGWIDENDSIYEKLMLWQKDDAGRDQLSGLKEHDIGAIYLGSQSTRFSLNSLSDNTTNGVVRSTGLYLKENGQARTMMQVDLAVS